MQNSIKLFKNEKFTFIKKQNYPHVGNSMNFVTKITKLQKLHLASNKTLTLWILTSKPFDLESCKTSQIVGNCSKISVSKNLRGFTTF